jgi:hypothetical protein
MPAPSLTPSLHPKLSRTRILLLQITMRPNRPAIEHVLHRAVHKATFAVPEVGLVHAVRDPVGEENDKEVAGDPLTCFGRDFVFGVGVGDDHFRGSGMRAC